jgi:hypothetical protein
VRCPSFGTERGPLGERPLGCGSGPGPRPTTQCATEGSLFRARLPTSPPTAASRWDRRAMLRRLFSDSGWCRATSALGSDPIPGSRASDERVLLARSDASSFRSSSLVSISILSGCADRSFAVRSEPGFRLVVWPGPVVPGGYRPFLDCARPIGRERIGGMGRTRLAWTCGICRRSETRAPPSSRPSAGCLRAVARKPAIRRGLRPDEATLATFVGEKGPRTEPSVPAEIPADSTEIPHAGRGRPGLIAHGTCWRGCDSPSRAARRAPRARPWQPPKSL